MDTSHPNHDTWSSKEAVTSEKGAYCIIERDDYAVHGLGRIGREERIGNQGLPPKPWCDSHL